jgi:hypothetical protein
MSPAEWSTIKNFSPRENWGEPQRMSISLLRPPDAFRSYLNLPIVVLCGTQGKHTENSQHYLGNAVDILVPAPIHPLDLILTAERFNFTGLGFYPEWQFQNHVWGGLHLDVRNLDPLQNKEARWLGLRDPKTGGNRYLDLTRENLKRYCQPGLF